MGAAQRSHGTSNGRSGDFSRKIGYINAHGTSTQANDSAESKAIELALGDAAKAYVSK